MIYMLGSRHTTFPRIVIALYLTNHKPIAVHLTGNPFGKAYEVFPKV